MQLLTDDQQQILAFISTCNRHGYSPTSDEILKWLESPVPAEALYERRKRKAISDLASSGGLSGVIVSDLNPSALNALTEAFTRPAREALAGIYSDITRDIGRSFVEGASYENVEIRPAETPVVHLVRIGWLASDSVDGDADGLSVTRLGLALLAASEEDDIGDDRDPMMVLGSDDPLAYPRLFGALSDLGPSLLIDPYLRLDQLHHVLANTEIDRVLITGIDSQKRNRAEISTYLQSVKVRKFEVRSSLRLHDRLAFATDGRALMFGISMNGVGRKTTVLTSLPSTAAKALKDEYEQLWNEGEVVASSQPKS